MSIRALPEELQEKAKIELNEVPERIQDDIKHIRDWLSKQLHLKARTDDQTLLTFLRGGKFSLERTKNKLDAFYTMQTLSRKLIKERNPSLPEVQEILKKGVFAVISDPTKPLLPVIIIRQWEKLDPEPQSARDMMKVLIMILDILVNECDVVTINGLILIEDFKGFSMQFASQITPSIGKIYVMAFQDVYPIRLKGVYVINAPGYFDTVFKIVKPFIKEKIKRRIKIYGSDFSDIFQHISKAVLPNEYGGEAGSIKVFQDECRKKIENYNDWFHDYAQYGADETKRPGTPETALGLDGSFRKLEFD